MKALTLKTTRTHSDIDWKGFHCLRTGVADKNKQTENV